ncbi:MAG: hypothetical protein P4M11_15835 [Candidatus Pacebacteria bacterium]|nr:hypothetical protein [Candidatus Paceibacterota bacterium]
MSDTSSELDDTDLEALSLASATRQQYQQALRHFLTSSHLTLAEIDRQRSRIVDRWITDYMKREFKNGGGYTRSSQALFALIFELPHLKSKLPHARRALKGWNNRRQQRSYPPLTWELTVVIAIRMAGLGRAAESIATLLAFDCYLRISEFTRLRRNDIAVPNDARLGAAHTAMALRLRNTKTGPNKWVSVASPQVAAALSDYLASSAITGDEFAFPFSPSRYRILLRSVCVELGIGSLGIVPHSLRHGGATRDFMLGRTIEQIQHRGRWASMKSAGRYVQQGPALLLQSQVPADLVETGRLLADWLAPCLEQLRASVPPSVPRTLGRVRFQSSKPGRR